MTEKVTKAQAERVLAEVAKWLGKKGYGEARCSVTGVRLGDETPLHSCGEIKYGPAPTGPEAAAKGLGPTLNMAWDWPSSGPTPTILLEGGPYDWAYECPVRVAGVYLEPYAGYALCIYPG